MRMAIMCAGWDAKSQVHICGHRASDPTTRCQTGIYIDGCIGPLLAINTRGTYAHSYTPYLSIGMYTNVRECVWKYVLHMPISNDCHQYAYAVTAFGQP